MQRAVHVAVAPVISHAGARLGAVVVLGDAGRAARGERERARLAMLLHRAEAVAHGNARSLELAERKFAAFMERLPFPAWIASDNGRTIFVNRAGQRAGGWREAIARDQASGDGAAVDRSRDARRYVAIRFPIRANGREWTGGVALDVTEAARAQCALRERDDEFDALVAHLPLPVWIARGGAPAAPANDAARALGAASCDSAIRECLQTLRPTCAVVRDGARTLAVTAVPIVDADGEARGALAFADENGIRLNLATELNARNVT
jgi:PAS domain-containing protein